MQKVTILCVGKLKEKFYIDAAAEYVKRLQRFCKLELVELPESRLPESPSPAEVQRALAAEAGLENAEKADSQDICFVPDGDYVGFLQRYGGVTPVPGDFVDQEGHVLGRHRGLECYTTGQRKGLGVSADAPLYVVRKDLDAGTVVLGPDSALYTDTLTAERVNLISLPALTGPIQVTAKTRYSQKEAEATVEPLEDGRVRVTFAQPQRAVTAGQAVVFYDDEGVVGGGTICGR